MLERQANMALCCKIVYFLGLNGPAQFGIETMQSSAHAAAHMDEDVCHSKQLKEP